MNFVMETQITQTADLFFRKVTVARCEQWNSQRSHLDYPLFKLLGEEQVVLNKTLMNPVLSAM